MDVKTSEELRKAPHFNGTKIRSVIARANFFLVFFDPSKLFCDWAVALINGIDKNGETCRTDYPSEAGKSARRSENFASTAEFSERLVNFCTSQSRFFDKVSGNHGVRCYFLKGFRHVQPSRHREQP